MLNTRASGLLCPIFSLPSRYGIGDLGPGAEDWIDALAAAGQRYWQLLPVHPTHFTAQHSPYNALSAFAGNIFLISPARMLADGWVKYLPEFKGHNNEYVDYDAAENYKYDLLEAAQENLATFARYRSAFDRFCARNAGWLEPYVVFRVAARVNESTDWTRWNKETADFETARRHLEREQSARLELERLGQFIFFQQWQALRRYATDRAVHLIGDLPLYVEHGSADVWTRRELFKLRRNGKPEKVAGVPPDYFSEKGQVWGNPVYAWDKHEAEDFSWWIARLRRATELFDYVRLDHFIGLVRYWELDAGVRNARKGEYREAPAEAFFRTVRRYFPSLPFLAEDLGAQADAANRLMDKFGLPGMRVLQFGLGDPKSPGNNIHLPHCYPANCVAYTGTHDNNTLRGWYRKELDKAGKDLLDDYVGGVLSEETVADAAIRLVWQSPANLAVTTPQDLLARGEGERMNTPATTRGNWKWRLRPNDLDADTWRELARLNELYGRN